MDHRVIRAGDTVRVLDYPDTQFGPSEAHTRNRERMVGRTARVVHVGFGMAEIEVDGICAVINVEHVEPVRTRKCAAWLDCGNLNVPVADVSFRGFCPDCERVATQG